jgi:hypothetical protein
MAITLQFLVLGLVTLFLLPIYRLSFSRLRRIPGPISYALTPWHLALDDLRGCSTRRIHSLHTKYGSVVRIGPSMVSFNSLDALKTIYGAGSRSQRTSFYKLFEPYGRPTMFTMSTVEHHRSVGRIPCEGICWLMRSTQGEEAHARQTLCED